MRHRAGNEEQDFRAVFFDEGKRHGSWTNDCEPDRRGSSWLHPGAAERSSGNAVYCRIAGGDTRASSRYAEKRATLIIIDLKSTRLNSSHMSISYAVFWLKKKKKKRIK